MAVQNSLAKATQKATFSTFITGDAVKQRINQMIGGNDGQRFVTSIISAVSVNPKLAECEHSTILSAAMLGESLKLSPSPQLGQYYLVPFNDKKKNCEVAQFQLGYKGYIQLAIRSGYYKKINVLAIKKGELVTYSPLDEELTVNLIVDDVERENTETTGYYAMFEYHNGFKKALYWSKQKMELHADKYSQAFKLDKYKELQAGKINKEDLWKYSSFWYKSFDDMALKTMLRQLISKWGIMSIELQKAFESDMGVFKEDGNVEFVDNLDIVENENVQTTPTMEIPAAKTLEGTPDFFN